MNIESKKILISVVVPVYNSATTLDELFASIVQSIDNSKYELEIIFVDDHGVPEVWKKLEEIKSANPDSVRIMRLAKNFGQNNSTLCGIDHSTGDLVVTIDDDLQFDPVYIPQLILKLEEKGSDVVYGVFKKQPGFSIRSMGRRALFFILDKFENGANIGSSFRLMRRNVVEKIKQHNQDHLFINQIISWYTSDIDQLQIDRKPRKEGRSGYSLGKLFKIGFKLIFYYTSFPIKIIIYFSFLAAITSFIFAAYYFIQKITVGTMQGYSSMIVSLFVGTSVIMVGIGVLAIFVNRIYSTRIRKPNYSVKKFK
jgi:glycosyltransferase involved in cell wall biosynthesis